MYNIACAEPGACNKPTVKNFDPTIHSNESLLRRLRAKNMQQNWPNLDGRSALPVCGEEGYIYNCNSCGPGGAPVSHYIGTAATNEPYAKRVAPMDIENIYGRNIYTKILLRIVVKRGVWTIISDETNPVGGGNQDDVPYDQQDVITQWLSKNKY